MTLDVASCNADAKTLTEDLFSRAMGTALPDCNQGGSNLDYGISNNDCKQGEPQYDKMQPAATDIICAQALPG